MQFISKIAVTLISLSVLSSSFAVTNNTTHAVNLDYKQEVSHYQ